MITLSTAFLLACSLLVGACGVAQAGVNSRLRRSLHSPIQAAFLSFLIGTLALGLVAHLLNAPWFAPGALAALPWWAWLGGLLGAFNVAMSVYLAPKLGALTLAISIVCGQVLASLVLDHNGWLGYPSIALSPPRLLGALSIVTGVLLVARTHPVKPAGDGQEGEPATTSPGRYLLLACSFAIGCSLASQAGINAELRTALGSPVQAAFISFLVGTLVLGLVAATGDRGWFRPGALATTPWWAWLGGILGAFIVTMALVLAPRLGALTLAIAIICGKIFCSLALDQKGWLGYPRVPLTIPRAVGTALMAAGVLLVAAN